MKKKATPSQLYAARLRRAREAAGLTQEAVAEYIRVDRTTYNKYETGKVQPYLQTAYALSVLFNVTLDEMLRPE